MYKILLIFVALNVNPQNESIAAQEELKILFKVRKSLVGQKELTTYDLDKRFIWTCYQGTNSNIELTTSLVLQNGPLCLCEPGGTMDGVGLHVSHVQGINTSKTEHLVYREIFLENQKCQSFAAYSP